MSVTIHTFTNTPCRVLRRSFLFLVLVSSHVSAQDTLDGSRGNLGLVQRKPGFLGGSGQSNQLSLANFANTAGDALAQQGSDEFAANFLKAVGAFANVAEGLPKPKPCSEGDGRPICRKQAKTVAEGTTSEAAPGSNETSASQRAKAKKEERGKKKDPEQEAAPQEPQELPKPRKREQAFASRVMPAPPGTSLTDVVGSARLSRTWQFFDASRAANTDVLIEPEADRNLGSNRESLTDMENFLQDVSLFTSLEDIPTESVVAPGSKGPGHKQNGNPKRTRGTNHRESTASHRTDNDGAQTHRRTAKKDDNIINKRKRKNTTPGTSVDVGDEEMST